MKKIVIALDVDFLNTAKEIVSATANLDAIYGYKIGISLVYRYSLPEVVHQLKRVAKNKKIILDGQKSGTDIPDMGKVFANICSLSGVDEVILFPLTGPKTAEVWIRACQDKDLTVIVGGHMTHEGFLDRDRSDLSPKHFPDPCGYISEDAPKRIYELAQKFGVYHFVVPGNKPEAISNYRELLGKDAIFYSPGLITQGGSISESGKAAGDNWNAIVGRAIYEAEDPRAEVEKIANELYSTV